MVYTKKEKLMRENYQILKPEIKVLEQKLKEL